MDAARVEGSQARLLGEDVQVRWRRQAGGSPRGSGVPRAQWADHLGRTEDATRRSCSPVRRHRTLGAARCAGGRDGGAGCSHRVGCRGVGSAANGLPGHSDVAAGRLGSCFALRRPSGGYQVARLPGDEGDVHVVRPPGPMLTARLIWRGQGALANGGEGGQLRRTGTLRHLPPAMQGALPEAPLRCHPRGAMGRSSAGQTDGFPSDTDCRDAMERLAMRASSSTRTGMW